MSDIFRLSTHFLSFNAILKHNNRFISDYSVFLILIKLMRKSIV